MCCNSSNSCWLTLQAKKKNHIDKSEAEKQKHIKKDPGFDHRWYTDMDAHLP